MPAARVGAATPGLVPGPVQPAGSNTPPLYGVFRMSAAKGSQLLAYRVCPLSRASWGEEVDWPASQEEETGFSRAIAVQMVQQLLFIATTVCD